MHFEHRVNHLMRTYGLSDYIVKATPASEIIYKVLFTSTLLFVLIVLRVCCKRKVILEKSTSYEDIKKKQ